MALTCSPGRDAQHRRDISDLAQQTEPGGTACKRSRWADGAASLSYAGLWGLVGVHVRAEGPASSAPAWPGPASALLATAHRCDVPLKVQYTAGHGHRQAAGQEPRGDHRGGSRGRGRPDQGRHSEAAALCTQIARGRPKEKLAGMGRAWLSVYHMQYPSTRPGAHLLQD